MVGTSAAPRFVDLTIVCAEDLRSLSVLGRPCKAYAVAWVGCSGEKRSTKAARSAAPKHHARVEWNEGVMVPVPSSTSCRSCSSAVHPDGPSRHHLTVQLFREGRMWWEDKLIGVVCVPLHAIPEHRSRKTETFLITQPCGRRRGSLSIVATQVLGCPP